MTDKGKFTHSGILKWIEEVAAITTPDRILICDGSETERAQIVKECLATGELIELNQTKMPRCYLHRSAPHDVARTEHLTFVCSRQQDDAGPNNNWMEPAAAKAKLTPLFNGSMKGRTMFVVPFLMGPPGSEFSKVGVEITDSRYVVLSMRIMTRVGQVALDQLGSSNDFTRCLHSLGDLSPDRRFIMHFPEENAVWSVGSGYGGNALLGKKCMALRLASWLARKEGWLAEHMLILGLQDPQNRMHYVCGAFPSACGKTNLAMLVPPPSMPGWKAATVGDDIAWLRPAPDGRLYAINPEAGFFGVVPGTSRKTNPTAFDMIQHDTLFTNVALRPDGTPWWEGHQDPAPAQALDWQGRPWTPGSAEKAAHPNSRFTTPATNCATLSPEFDNPSGVPIEAILFGARRQRRVPLVYEARSWQHGTFLGATLSSETTAAATGKVGVLRRDPMAMWPFCGYNMGDYFQHWLDVGETLTRPPKIFRVNWFRTGEDGKFLWPGFGDNLRVLQWVLERCADRGEYTDTAIGYIPTPNAIDRKGLAVTDQQMAALLKVDPAEWVEAVAGQEDLITKFGSHFPPSLRHEHDELARRIHTEITPEELEGRDSGT
ncbi:MAG TPA: phosphoenolpyruvate carboxykinase (GTP) [Vicinamibacterales bacterium]|jgi:phosphoenolpyruvate carboxykinase (GTP)|nr:phosphoenolpyruvate carboxykinase (GTP) [Vicinamibacterales bacterium]